MEINLSKINTITNTKINKKKEYELLMNSLNNQNTLVNHHKENIDEYNYNDMSECINQLTALSNLLGIPFILLINNEEIFQSIIYFSSKDNNIKEMLRILIITCYKKLSFLNEEEIKRCITIIAYAEVCLDLSIPIVKRQPNNLIEKAYINMIRIEEEFEALEDEIGEKRDDSYKNIDLSRININELNDLRLKMKDLVDNELSDIDESSMTSINEFLCEKRNKFNEQIDYIIALMIQVDSNKASKMINEDSK